MEVFYPKYYEHFSCIASACPDSCCKEWSVDVDAQSAAYYRALPGSLGDRLRQVLHDTDDGTIMTIENGRCPMWRQDGLCQIQKELGHDALCKVCRDFPRLSHNYGDFTELGLELSCPEAARLILSDDNHYWVRATRSGSDAPEYDPEVMATLRHSRNAFEQFLDATTLPFPHILAVLLLYAYDVQAEIDGGSPAVLTWEKNLTEAQHFAKRGDVQSIYDFFLGLEILTPQWAALLKAPSGQLCWTFQHKALLRYFIGRYWLQAIADYDFVCRAKFAIISCLLIGLIGGNITQTAQLFSKEIENDPDNVEAILDAAYTAAAFTDLNLLGLLLQ